MERGSYVAASGGVLQLQKLEVVNNNLANSNTVGFKKQVLLGETQTFEQTLAALTAGQDPFAEGDHDRTPGIVEIRSSTDFTPGAVKNTGNPLDVALRNANDFFALQTASGVQYTRAGNFTLNSEGDLVTQDGQPVLGDGGTISVSGGSASIASNGAVLVNGNEVGVLQVVRIENPQLLTRTEGTRFSLQAGGAAPEQVDAELVPEALEMSNVSSISSVIDLITTQRAFEMYTKSAQSIDQLNQAAITQIGRRNG